MLLILGDIVEVWVDLRRIVMLYYFLRLAQAVQAAQAGVNQLAPIAEIGLDLCYQMTAPPNMTMSFMFEGADGLPKEYALDPYNIWLNVAQDEWCVAIRSSPDQSIIGNIAQANHFIETDIVGATIGWLSVDCLTSF